VFGGYPLRNRLLSTLIGALLAALLSGCGPKPEGGESKNLAPSPPFLGKPLGDTLNMTVVPYEAAEKLSDEYTPMAKYLARKMGKKEGVFRAVVDYAGVLAALESGQVDVAYLSPFPYALASSRMQLHPLAMPYVRNNLLYHGILFVRAESPIKTLQDLKGRVVAFGDPTSTSGYLLPRALLEKSGVPIESLKRYYNAGNADLVVKAVEEGMADAGAAYHLVFEVVYRSAPEKAKRMRIIGKTEEIPNGIYVARPDLPTEEVERLRKAFLDMNTDPEGRAAMLKAPNDRIVAADDNLFTPVREVAQSQGIDIALFDKKK
jgi:phosphonate transport system substrate-binding protein